MIVPICLPGALEVGHVPLGSWKKEPHDKGTALKTLCLSLLSQRTSKWKSVVTTLIVELLNNMRAYYSHLGGLEHSMFIQVNWMQSLACRLRAALSLCAPSPRSWLQVIKGETQCTLPAYPGEFHRGEKVKLDGSVGCTYPSHYPTHSCGRRCTSIQLVEFGHFCSAEGKFLWPC